MRTRPAARAASGRTAASSSTRSGFARPYKGVPIVDRRYRGEPAPHRAFRLLVRAGAPLGAGRRQGGPAGLRQCGAADRRDRAPAAMPGEADLEHHGSARHRLSAPRRTADDWIEIDSTELDTPGPLAPPPDPYAGEDERRRALGAAAPRAAAPDTHKVVQVLPQGAERAARAQRHPHALLRAGERGFGAVRARVANLAPGVESRQCARARAAPRQPRGVAQSSADSLEHGGDGRDLRAALCAPPAPDLRRVRGFRPTT